MRYPSILLILAAACGSTHEIGVDTTLEPEGVELPGLPDVEAAPAASDRLESADLPADVASRVDGYFEGFGSRRVHVQLDRPLYRPGDAVWVKSWSVLTRGLTGNPHGQVTYELVNPRGLVVETKMVPSQGGTATNDFMIDASAPGGLWTLRATLPTGEIDERPFVVSSYQAPRIRKQLDFVREAYGPGDRVEAMVEMLRPSGGPLADHKVRAVMQVAGSVVFEGEFTTDETGAVFVSAELSKTLASSDGLLTVFVEDGGVTESISRSVPIALSEVNLDFFPEGGGLVQGLPSRVYFEGTNRFGEPADVSGYVTNDRGQRVAEFSSLHDGMGRFELNPEPGRAYIAHVTAPVGVEKAFVLPEAQTAGCVLRSFDDLKSEQEALRVAVRCHEDSEVLVAGVLRETVLDVAPVKAGPGEDTIVYLASAETSLEQGAARVTVFDKELNALAERLVYRNAGKDLRIEMTTQRESYGPRDEVVVSVKSFDPSGAPVAAELAVSVVDDGVVSLADDENGHMLSRLYLEPDLVDSPKDPAFYYDDEEALAARGLDLVMGVKGYRRFEWQRVWSPPVLTASLGTTGVGRGGGGQLEGVAIDGFAMHARGDAPVDLDEMEPMELAFAAAPPPPVEAAPVVAMPMAEVPRQARDERKKKEVAAGPRKPMAKRAMDRGVEDILMEDELDIAGEAFWGGGGLIGHGRMANNQQQWATVRVFPKPDYAQGFSGTRTDFRDTVHWEPTVQTDAEGKAEMRFYLSDAVTTFRMTAEGLGAASAGHAETTFSSVLPVSIATKIPPAVSAGDSIWLPLTVSSSRSSTLAVDVLAELGSSLLTAKKTSGDLALTPAGSDTFWVPIDVGNGADSATLTLSAEGGGLSDVVERTLEIVPPGFPRGWSEAGEMDDEVAFTMQLDEAVEGSLYAAVTWQPSTVSTLIQGMDALIQTPGGCFEQTSSTNWPNVAILNYLEAHDGDPRLRMKSSQALDAGYAKLTGYQVGAGGFETWGSGPGKEVLSAFGLLQFADMANVYPVADSVLTRDAAYLLEQRDGKGGFKNTGESAHGYGSAPAPVLNGFITYALVATGNADGLDREVEAQAKVAQSSTDPYVLALAARVLQESKHAGAPAAVARLAELQADDGSFPGAESSITRSYEANLLVESTALAAMVLMDDVANRSAADTAVSWLIDNRRGVGSWGATQATALALDALTTHAEVNKRPRTGGSLAVEVNGERVGMISYDADQEGPIVIGGWQDALETGENTIVLRQLEGEALPFTVDVGWKSVLPTSSPGAELSLATTLSETEVSMGDTVRLTATVSNEAGRIVPSPIARIGLPAGLEAQTWQLEQLQERGEIAFFETRPREVTLYWDGLHDKASHEVALDLVASVPGSFTGPASSAYPYYNDDEMAWVGGLEVSIDR
ncbi:MAG: hypothetical protein KC912_03900 [Proteobacteria bacterium]|nr:hypothetical protein [Pseudomonadota bacterium]